MSTAKIRTFLDCVRRTARAADLEGQTDRQLLECFARCHDEVAFACLVRRHGALVLGVCWRVLRHREDAEDAFQATFLALAGCAARTRWREGVSGWLHDVAYRVAAKAKVARARRRAYEERGGIMRRAKGSPAPGAEELGVVLDEELSRLSEPYRTLLVQCYLEGKGHDQVARELGYSPATFKRRLQRGRELLRLRLARRGVALSTALLIAGLADGVAEAGGTVLLVGSTVRAAALFAAGQGVAAGSVPSRAAALAQGVLQTLSQTKVKVVLVAVMTLALTAAGPLIRQVLVAPAAERRTADESKAADQPAAGESEQVRLDRYGDPLPPGALARLGTMRLRHNEYGQLIFTPDGKGLITAGGDNLPRLWDVATGKLRHEFRTIVFPVFGAALSSDGRILAVRDRMGSVYLLETATGKRLREFKCEKNNLGRNWPSLKNFAFSPDSKTIAVQLDGRLELREVATGRLLCQKNEQDIAGLAFSPDGKTLASAGGSDGVRLWDARTGDLLRTLGHKREIHHFAFSPDGRTLAVGYDGQRQRKDSHRSVHLWDVATGKEVRQLGEPDKHIAAPVFSLDGKIVATRGEGGIRLWETATGKELHRCQHTHPHWPWVSDPAVFSPDGKVLAALDGPLVRFWDTASGKALPSQLPKGHESAVNSVAFTPDGQTLISAAGEHTIRWWDTRTGRERLSLSCTKTFPLHWEYPKAVLSPDGTMLAAACADAPEGEDHVEETVRTEGRSSIRLWDAATGKELRRLDSGNGCTFGLAFSPDSKVLAEVFCANNGFRIVNGQLVRLWDVASGKRRKHELAGSCPLFSPDGRILATLESGNKPGNTERMIHFWEVATGKKVRSISTNGHGCLALSPDGKTLAAGGFGAIALYPLSWDKPSGVEVGASRLVDCSSHGAVIALAFSLDGRMLASSGSGDHLIHLWETASGKERARFPGHSLTDIFPSVTSLSFTADGRRLASGSRDSTILLWDVTGRLRDGDLRPAKLSDKELEGLWTDLASSDTVRAGRAVWTLAAAGPPTVSFLQARLRPVAARATPEAVARLLADLDADDFRVREKARRELEELGESCESALRQALAKQLSVEARRSLQRLLSQLEEARRTPSGEVLRGVHAVEVLEQIGTPEARQILKTLATGVPLARLTHEAQAALERLERTGRR